jgi:hypothetical protein
VAWGSVLAHETSPVSQVALVYTPMQQQPVGAVAHNYMDRSSHNLLLQLGMVLHSCRLLVLASTSRLRRDKKVSSAVVALVLCLLAAAGV